MPVSGEAGIGGVVENGDGDRLGADKTAEVAPASASAPGGVALLAFTCQIGAVDAGVVQFGDGGGAAAGVGVDLGFVRRDFESADDAKAQDAVFLILEINFFVERAERGDAVDAAKAGAATEDEVGVFLEQNFFVEGDPIGFDIEFALVGAALCGDDGAMEDGAHLRRVFRLDGVGIVPEIDAIYVFIVEPETGVMGMIYAFARALFEREAASDDGAFGGAEGVENRFFERGGPNIGGERLTVDGDIDAASLLVDGNGDAVRRMGSCGGERHENRSYRDEHERYTGSNRNAHS